VTKALNAELRHVIFAKGMRSITDIVAAEKEMFDKVWYGRSDNDPASAHPHLDPAMIDQILAARRRVEESYGYDVGQPGDQFEPGADPFPRPLVPDCGECRPEGHQGTLRYVRGGAVGIRWQGPRDFIIVAREGSASYVGGRKQGACPAVF
jgi:hypothetical protein